MGRQSKRHASFLRLLRWLGYFYLAWTSIGGGAAEAFAPLRPLTTAPGYRTIRRVPSRWSSALHSLQPLVEELFDARSARTVFVGGKGGVGKTTVAAALATALAADGGAADRRVLVVSTDPAHSLGDALDEDLRAARGAPRVLTDPVTGGRLWAQEVDAAAALESFRESLAAFDVDRLADSLGVPMDLLEGLGLREFSGFLNNPPPGLDELVALGDVLDPKRGEYDLIIVDTAPTGHTLRLLQLPQFLDGLLGKLIQLRLKLSGLASTLQAFLGDAEASQRAKVVDDAAQRLDAFREKMAGLKRQLQDPQRTDFVVVTVPTKLGVAESVRLVTELNSQNVRVSDLVVNQCVGDVADQDLDALQRYYTRRKAGQSKWIDKLQEAIDEVSASSEFQSNGDSGPVTMTKVPFFDVELVGVPALNYVGSTVFSQNPSFQDLMEGSSDSRIPKVLICGGKGGTGKTTTASSLAVTMAAQGHHVAVISTDPAHSLGDALDVNLSGGSLQSIPLVGIPATDGSLSALEIDPAVALSQFKGIVDSFVGNDDSSSSGGGGIRSTLKELEEIFDTLPAGTDEVVALAKIVNLVKKGEFDRIVLDTAPTGHTLRMLSTPAFLADLIDRLLNIAEKVNSNAMVRMLVSGGGNNDKIESAASAAKSQLLSFQLQMYDLEDMFADSALTEFLIVTVPTELASRESVRLMNDLTFNDPPIKVRNLVVNQVLSDDENDTKTFLDHVASTQKYSIEKLEQATSSFPSPPRITIAQYLDTEPRGVFGLKAFADGLLKGSEPVSVS